MTVRVRTEFCSIHCSATKPSQDIDAAEIRRWHKKKGWDDIGYHFVVRRDGTIERGRHVVDIGAHTYGFNRISIGICMIGGIGEDDKPENNFTTQQWVSLGRLVEYCKRHWPGIKFRGHRDFSPDVDGDGVIEKWEWLKDCPSFDVAETVYTDPIDGVSYGPGYHR